MTLSAQLFVSLCIVIVLPNLFLGVTSYLIYLERKMASWIQDRVGPNRCGFTFGLFGDNSKKRIFGLGQPLADGLKFLAKEDYDPDQVDKALFYLAPAMACATAMIGWAVIPFGGAWLFPGFDLGFLKVLPGTVVVSVADINVGVIYILAVGSLAVYGVVLGAWASNNKFAFFGGIRGAAQMLSYEIPMGLAVLCILLMTGSASASDMLNAQIGHVWNIVQQPLLAVLFFTCVLAECNRAPFDLPECEAELVGGYHTEYSSMKFALFFLGEYLHMITGAAFFTLMFLGGWSLPFVDVLNPAPAGIWIMLAKVAVFLIKVTLVISVMMWIRWTLPRFRFDQLMRLAWRSMIPLSLGLLLITGVFTFLDLNDWLWAGNIGLFIASLIVAPLIPAGPNVNRRIKLEGSRYSAPA
ncbi:MAG: complex I subunit 1 family protein [Phycisphaeraceae bacterium]